MSAEIIATLVLFGMVLVVFGALAVLVVTQTRGLRRSIGELEGRLCGRFDSMHGELRDAADRMAYMNGLVSGLAPAIIADRENRKPSIKASDDPKSIAE